MKEFIEEANTHLDDIEVGLLALENGGFTADTIHTIFRAVHSIKGTAGFFSLKTIVMLSHAMESALGGLRKGSIAITNEAVEALLMANDCLKALIRDAGRSEQFDIAVHIAKMEAILSGQTAGGTPIQPLRQNQAEPAHSPLPDLYPELTDRQLDLIRQAHDHGKRIQRVTYPLTPGEPAKPGEPPVEITKKITSIGQMIAYDAFPGFGLFLIATVLEKSLTALALGIAEEHVAEQDFASYRDSANERTSAAGEFAAGGRPIDPFVPAADPAVTADPAVADHSAGSAESAGSAGSAGSAVSAVPFDPFVPSAVSVFPVVPIVPAIPVAPIVPAVPVPSVFPDEPPLAHESNLQPASDETIRVPVPLLNDLLNLASEMVLGRNQLLRLLNSQRKGTPGLNTVLQNIDNITTELQEKIMQTRMQPLARVFNKFPRIIRELAKKMGKDIDLRLDGMDVELDKSIIEALGDPLTHLVRNAADHGLETPEEREAGGKPRTGTLTLKAYHEGGHVTIDVTDSGRGIAIDRIKDKAVENGLISRPDAELLGESELLLFLFRPGFSTAARITDLSGRGVGLDVVKTNIERLGGIIEMMTNPGQGTTTRLTLPLTLAIIPSIIVEVKGLKFALPQVNLQEMVRIKPGDRTKRMETYQNFQVFRLRGKLLPVIQLDKVLGLSDDPPDTGSIIRMLVIKSGSKRFGLIVDRIHDGEEILVKHLPKYLANGKCYSGVTILGDGRIAMILDPEGIAVKASFRFLEEGHGAAEPAQQEHRVISERQSLLLFQCSGPETFSIDLAMVSRVEKIHASRIERIGDKEFIQFRNEALRLIRPEHYYPVAHRENNREYVFIIIPKLAKSPIGLIAETIIDTLETNIEFNQEDVKAKGLVGSAILNGRICLVINLYELYEMVAPEHFGKDFSPFHAAEEKVILIVEDTPFFAKIEKQYLEQAGYKVLSAGNGKEAWDILQGTPVDVLVSDIEMPVMNGYELMKRIRADSSLSALPAIAVTSKADQRSIDKGIEAGFDHYEIKLDKNKLLKKVALALQKNVT